MKLKNLIISAIVAVMSLANTAQSQDLMGFDRASFGSVVLSRTQAVGTGIQLELSVGSYENEPMSNYKDTVFADIGRSVGRLDVLTDKGTFPCTAFIVSKQHILTNYHCSLGLLDDERIGATRIDASQFVAGYTQTGVDEGTKKFTVIPTPVETSAELDYAVLEVIGNPSQEFGELKLASLVPNDRAPLWIIGHPQGKGQHISREKCRASAPAVSRNTLLHTCDTLPGNSGSPVIDAGLQQVVALHHAGIANDSVNAAILMSKILENSTVLATYRAPEDVLKSQPGEPKTTAKTACDALFSAAVEAKACYAYNAYKGSCKDHSLVPIADGYIKKFCQPQETVKVNKTPEKTCVDDPSLCSADQLCGQSLTFKSGKAAWRTDNFIHVAEAERRELSCGVMEVVVLPKKTCAKDVTVCSAIQLCAKAIYYNSGAKAWRVADKHVTEAKRRGLTCGVTKVAAKPNGQCQGSYNAVTWDNCFGTWSDGEGAKYVGQWKNGKYNGKGTVTYANGDKYVGQFNDNKFSGQGVGTYADRAKYVGQYKGGSRNGHGFFFLPDRRAYFCTFANDKGSNCIGSNAYDVAITLKNQFTALPTSQRKIIQSNLKRGKHYTSSVDGQWGPGTLMALVEFSSMNLGTVDLQSASASKKILNAVKRGEPYSEDVAQSKKECLDNVQMCSETQICTVAANGAAGQRYWTKNSEFVKYVTEAKRRGLTCGVTEVVAKKTCREDVKVCNQTELCTFAVDGPVGERKWNQTSPQHVALAKRRGLTCEVDVIKSIKTAFENESVLRRKQIQYALKELNYYKSTIDALYGQGTQRALTEFSEVQKISGLGPDKVFSSLLNQVSVPTFFAPPKPKKCSEDAKSCNASRLCHYATDYPESKIWAKESKFFTHVSEAKRRGLDCGVNIDLVSETEAKEQSNKSISKVNSTIKKVDTFVGEAIGATVKTGLCVGTSIVTVGLFGICDF